MVGRQGLLLKQRPSWPVIHQETLGMAYALYETAWANAWPHLDDWFIGRNLDDWFTPRGASDMT